MVTALVARWGLGNELYRETGDADLGVPPILVRERQLIERLTDLGYSKVAGNRWARPITDIPVRLNIEADERREALIDILVPAYTSRPRQDRRIGEHLVTNEVPGLAAALIRPPVVMTLELYRLNGDKLDVDLSFPDEVGALVLKSHATSVRTKATDIVDVWRCLEVAYAAGVGPEEFVDDTSAESAAIVRTLFAARAGWGMEQLIGEQRLSAQAADKRFTRLQGLIARVLGPA